MHGLASIKVISNHPSGCGIFLCGYGSSGIRAFTAASLKGVCFLSFRKNFKKVTKTLPHQLP
jgi:hypothetical protein